MLLSQEPDLVPYHYARTKMSITQEPSLHEGRAFQKWINGNFDSVADFLIKLQGSEAIGGHTVSRPTLYNIFKEERFNPDRAEQVEAMITSVSPGVDGKEIRKQWLTEARLGPPEMQALRKQYEQLKKDYETLKAVSEHERSEFLSIIKNLTKNGSN